MGNNVFSVIIYGIVTYVNVIFKEMVILLFFDLFGLTKCETKDGKNIISPSSILSNSNDS